jgi:hypothetical protein
MSVATATSSVGEEDSNQNGDDNIQHPTSNIQPAFALDGLRRGERPMSEGGGRRKANVIRSAFVPQPRDYGATGKSLNRYIGPRQRKIRQ